MTWFTALATWPAPLGPRWVMRLPIASRIGRARATSSSRPPQKIVSVPFCAPSDPPDTGASTMPMPRSASFAAIAAVAEGETVEQSTTTPPDPSPSATPPGPSSTCSRSGVSDTHTSTASAFAAASAGDAARAAPASASGSSRSRVRLCTVTSWPAASRCPAIGAPIVPRPITATLIAAESTEAPGRPLTVGPGPESGPGPGSSLAGDVAPLLLHRAAQDGRSGDAVEVVPEHRRHEVAAHIAVHGLHVGLGVDVEAEVGVLHPDPQPLALLKHVARDQLAVVGRDLERVRAVLITAPTGHAHRLPHRHAHVPVAARVHLLGRVHGPHQPLLDGSLDGVEVDRIAAQAVVEELHAEHSR